MLTEEKATRTKHRDRRARESFGTAAEAIGPIDPGMSLFLVTRGQFSMVDMIHHVLAEIGPAEISCWTWAVAEYETEMIESMLTSGMITGGTLLVDASCDKRNPHILERWRQRFGEKSVRVCKNHAKIARVWNGKRRVLLRGSCNLNFNPRFEQCDVTEGGEDFDMVERIEAEIPVLPRTYTNAEATAASGVDRAFEPRTLELFDQSKVWKP